MDATPKTRKSLFDGLTRILHLHQLPQKKKNDEEEEHNPWKNQTSASSAILSPRAPIPPISGAGSPLSSSRDTLNIASPLPSRNVSPAAAPTPTKSAQSSKTTSTAKPVSSSAASVRAPPVAPSAVPSPAAVVSRNAIVTDYDRIYELVRAKLSIKLDEIARVLALKEERVAQELQTLEDNGMVEVRYPAFGEPLIVYKSPEA